MKLRAGIPGIVATLFVMCGDPAVALAQATPESDQPAYRNVVSANPFGILIELFNAEFEHAIGETTSAGIGGSYFGADEEEDYLNADVFLRYYMQDRALEGWAFGAKAGLTNVPDQGTYFGVGFDLNRNWLMGKRDNFYIGAGFGLKRLLGVPSDAGFDLKVIPTIRIINVGIAF